MTRHDGEISNVRDNAAAIRGDVPPDPSPEDAPFPRPKRDLLDLRREIETFVYFSPWRDDVPAVPQRPVAEWGTLAWARFALALLEAR